MYCMRVALVVFVVVVVDIGGGSGSSSFRWRRLCRNYFIIRNTFGCSVAFSLCHIVIHCIFYFGVFAAWMLCDSL